MPAAKKGQMSFTIKAFVLVATIIAFLILIMFVSSFTQKSEKREESLSLEMKAMSDVQKLVSSKDCLAYDVEGKPQRGIIDVGKLEGFVGKYPDIEPECALEGEFDYKVNVTEEPMSLMIYSSFPGEIEYIFNQINGKNTIFLIDTSASMNEPCGTYNKVPKNKIECVEMFLKNFADRLSGESKMGLYAYPLRAWVFEMTPIESYREPIKNKIILSANGGTPMCTALKEAFSYSSRVKTDAIVLLTDGCENSNECWIGDSLKVVEQNLDKEIVIHTIAFGEDVEKCTDILKKIANLTDGAYYRALTCEDLAGKTPQHFISVSEKSWAFGINEFSPGRAKYDEKTVSIPVTLRYDSNSYRSGTISLRAVGGELERISSAINQICSEDRSEKMTLQMKISYPVKYSGGKLCVESASPICKTISCQKQVEFENIDSAGDYIIRIQNEGGKITVKT